MSISKASIREFLTFLCFLVLAGVVWYGYSMGAVRSVIIPVNVTYQGLTPIIECEDSLPRTLHVEVRDAGYRLKVYVNNPLHITMDIHEQVKNDRGTILIPSEVIRSSITNLLQGTTNLQVVNPEHIECRYYRQTETRVPIRLAATFEPSSQYQLVGEPKMAQSTVAIFGSAQAIGKVKEVYTSSIQIRDIKDRLTQEIPLICPLDVQLSQPSVEVMVETERFTEKEVIVPVQVCHVPSGEHIRIFPAEVKVALRIGMSNFTKLNDNQVTATCDYPTHQQTRLPITIHCANRHVTYMRSTPSSVEYIIEK